MTTEVKIRRLYDVQGLSIKEIMRQTSLSRNTVRRIIRAKKAGEVYERNKQVKPKLGEHEGILVDWLETDKKLPRKQRRSATKCFTELKKLGYQGAYDSVQRFIKGWKAKRMGKSDAYIPLAFDAGDAYQFDWSEEYVEIAGVAQKIKVAHFRLCYSRQFFVVAYLRETQEMLIDAHNQAFAFFGGLPRRGIYDNLKTAISQVLVGKDRVFTRGFLSLMDHYRIEPVACTPASGWEKGQVERQVENMRDWLFRPRMKAESLEALNQHLYMQCQELAASRTHPTEKGATIAQIFAAEQEHLRTITSMFESYNEQTVSVSSTCLVQFDRNCYSVPCCYANQTVSLRIYPGHMEAWTAGEKIAEHVRQFGREKRCFDPWHYVPLLERKPGALRNGEPFKDWKLPISISQVKDKLIKRKGGDRECVAILCAITEHGLEAVEVACELALQDDTISQAVILNILNRLHQNAINLKLTEEPTANCQHYDQLLAGGQHAL